MVNDLLIYYVLLKPILREPDKEYLTIPFTTFSRTSEVLTHKSLPFDIDKYRGVPESFYENVDGGWETRMLYLSRMSSSSWLRSQAMYSNEASVIRGHQDRSKERSFLRFSAISSTPSSVILLQPDMLSTVRLGKECTMLTIP